MNAGAVESKRPRHIQINRQNNDTKKNGRRRKQTVPKVKRVLSAQSRASSGSSFHFSLFGFFVCTTYPSTVSGDGGYTTQNENDKYHTNHFRAICSIVCKRMDPNGQSSSDSNSRRRRSGIHVTMMTRNVHVDFTACSSSSSSSRFRSSLFAAATAAVRCVCVFF